MWGHRGASLCSGLGLAFSGGCGAMYEIHIESEEFREKRTVQQHQMVNQVRGLRGCPGAPSGCEGTGAGPRRLRLQHFPL